MLRLKRTSTGGPVILKSTRTNTKTDSQRGGNKKKLHNMIVANFLHLQQLFLPPSRSARDPRPHSLIASILTSTCPEECGRQREAEGARGSQREARRRPLKRRFAQSVGRCVEGVGWGAGQGRGGDGEGGDGEVGLSQRERACERTPHGE